MRTKEEVLYLLERARGAYVSGEEIADKLGVTRAAVWKAIRALSDDGYGIDAVKNKGYALAGETDILSEQGIRAYLPERYAALPITVHAEVTSTNAVAMTAAEADVQEGALFVAERQTQGRGRIGKSFFSPVNGLYMSVVLRPQSGFAEAAMITPAAAVAVAETLIGQGFDAKIKWVNDVYVGGKKVCGILTQAVTDVENSGVRAAVVGIGVNYLWTPEQRAALPAELKQKAGALFSEPSALTRNQLIAEIASRLFDLRKDGDFMDAYRKHSMMLGKRIRYVINGAELIGTVIGIDDRCGLEIDEDGRTRVLTCGEVSVYGLDMRG